MHCKSGFKLRQLGDEYILVGESIEQVNFNKMITMNESAAYLWQHISDGVSFDAEHLASLLRGEYEVSAEQARKDAEQMIQAWLNAGIIE